MKTLVDKFYSNTDRERAIMNSFQIWNESISNIRENMSHCARFGLAVVTEIDPGFPAAIAFSVIELGPM